jgi:N-methylhydantoinase B
MIYACVLQALGKLNPARAVAPSGFGTGAIAIGYAMARTGKAAVQYELMNCGLGGTASHDGTSIVMPINHFTPSTPIEIVETEYPIMVKRFDMWPDSAGAGKSRGGVGYTREYQMLMPTMLTARTSNHREGASGLNGGKGPPVARTIIDPETPNEIALGAIETRQVAANSTVRLDQSGGGGYGDPFERPAELVAQDVADGYVSPEGAARDYGVVVTADGSVDAKATAARRSKR